MKKLLIFTLFSFLVSFDTFEYSIGLNDKLIYTGLVSKSWIKVEDNRETYIILGNSFLLSGAVGYGKKYYFFRNSSISPYLSLTGFGYYVLGIGAIAGGAVSASLGFDVDVIDWKKNRLMLQLGVCSAYDLVNDMSLVIEGEGGPSFLMPSFNIKLLFDQ